MYEYVAVYHDFMSDTFSFTQLIKSYADYIYMNYAICQMPVTE